MFRKPLEADVLGQLFLDARTQNDWHPEPLPESLIRQLYDLLKFGPTAVNGAPARFVFCTSAEAKEKLANCTSGRNADKILKAPATVVVGMDLKWFAELPTLFPHVDAGAGFAADQQLSDDTAFRNSSLQGAWLIMAARALGLDAGPMSGFDNSKVDEAFFAGTSIQSNFICSIGYGTGEKVHPRLPRLSFEDACQIL